MTKHNKLIWHRVLNSKSELAEGRVMTVTAGHKGLCITHFGGKISALDNKCPHQGGPLGEGSIENGLLRCPWHGWDYHPCTGKAPGFDDGVAIFPTEERRDGIYVGMKPESAHAETVSDVMAQTMVNWGVDTVFGMVGHSNLGMADALRRQEKKGNLKFYGIRHEGAASFAASAYAKLTGKPAACFAIAGPGSTNMFTGLWDAKVDRAPILALTGQVATQVVGTGNFQELDLVAAFQTVAGFNHRVQHESLHGELMNLALKHSILKREVSHLTLPDEVQVLPAGKSKSGSSTQRVPELQITPSANSLEQAKKLLRESEKPIIIVGYGAKFHMDGIVEFAEKLNAPVMTTFKAKGQISDSHPLGCGVLGRSGTPIASWFMNEADLLIVFGASFSKHTGITPKIPTIQVDFDPMALSKFHKIDVPLWGEISTTVKILSGEYDKFRSFQDRRNEIVERWRIWKAEKSRRLKESFGLGLNSVSVFHSLNQYAPANAVMCVDVGNNAYSFGRYFESKNHSFLMSGYLGSIGFALPASLGAWAAVKGKRPVVAVAGDGGLAQYLAEITTLVKYRMDVKLIILNNSELGKISKEQRASNFDVWATKLTNPNFAEFAASCGAWGRRVATIKDLDGAMEELFEVNGPGLLEVMTDVNLI